MNCLFCPIKELLFNRLRSLYNFYYKEKKKLWLSTVRNFMSTDLTWQNYFKVSKKTLQHW